MAGIGIVSNPRSRRNLRDPGTAGRLARLLGDEGRLLAADTPGSLAAAVRAFREAGVDVLAVNGGDGTLHRVVTGLAEGWGPAPWPLLLPLRGGAMNTVAHAHGLRGGPERLLRRLLEQRRDGREPPAVERDLLSVEVPGAPPAVGFLFGTGLAVTFLEAWYQDPEPSWATALLLLLRAAGSAVARGPLARRLSHPMPLRIASDGDEWPADAFLAVVAGAIPELGFGFAPLARCAEQPGSFHAVGITGTPLQLALRMPAVWLGRPWRRPLALDAVARDLLLDAPRLRYTVDGDLFTSDGPVRVRAGPVARVASARPGAPLPS